MSLLIRDLTSCLR